MSALLACGLAGAQQRVTNYDESKVGSYTLPDPLIFNDGSRVRTAGDWTKRRAEILELFATDVYGHSPRAPKSIAYEVTETNQKALDGRATRKQVTIWFGAGNAGPKENLLLYIPAASAGPIPAILSLNFDGNHEVTTDPGVKLPTVWNPHTHQPEQATEDSRGRDSNFEVEKVLAHGYAFATMYYQDIEPDFLGGYPHGIRPFFLKPGQTEPGPDEWGAIGAWAYGLSRAMDYLEKDKDIDPRRVAVMGHSRLGKTALWASALDRRFAMALASCPGEGGASLARRNYGETVRDLVNVFPYWFAPNLAQYADDVDRLPVDMHELIALSAPRPVYVTAAEDDKWADPKGEFLAMVGAGPVYRLLGARDLGTDRMPALNEPIMTTLGFHCRTGKHETTAFDWDQFLAFGDIHLKQPHESR